jgi:hypothetical protein
MVRERARARDFLQRRERSVVDLLMAAGLVELDHPHVRGLEEVAHRRIDEGQVPVLADAQDGERGRASRRSAA